MKTVWGDEVFVAQENTGARRAVLAGHPCIQAARRLARFQSCRTPGAHARAGCRIRPESSAASRTRQRYTVPYSSSSIQAAPPGTPDQSGSVTGDRGILGQPWSRQVTGIATSPALVPTGDRRRGAVDDGGQGAGAADVDAEGGHGYVACMRGMHLTTNRRSGIPGIHDPRQTIRGSVAAGAPGNAGSTPFEATDRLAGDFDPRVGSAVGYAFCRSESGCGRGIRGKRRPGRPGRGL